jgi:hypothetical protein
MNTDERTELNLAWHTLVEAVGLDPATVPALHNRGLLNVGSVDAITAVARAVIDNNRQWVTDQKLAAPVNTLVDEIKCWRFHSHVETDGQSVRYVYPIGNARHLAAAQRATDNSGALNVSRAEQTAMVRTMQRDIELLRAEVAAWRSSFDLPVCPMGAMNELQKAREQTDDGISTPFPEEISE